MNKERLLNVAKALREADSTEKFTMTKFVHGCGTPACALGHYAARRDLQDEFLITKDRFGSARLVHVNGTHPLIDGVEVLEHFDLDEDLSIELFDGNGCDGAETAESAAEYIEDFVARGGK